MFLSIPNNFSFFPDEVFNKKINYNWSRIFRAAQPGIQKVMSESVFKLLSDFFEAVPFNEVFHVDY